MSSHHVKGIYKQLLRYGRTLTYTDKDYFYRRIRYISYSYFINFISLRPKYHRGTCLDPQMLIMA